MGNANGCDYAMSFGKAREGLTRVTWGVRPLPVLVSFLLLLLLPSANAQLYTGSVTGVVTDPSGAVVPSANVTLLDEQKGYTFSAKTDATGRYIFRQVPPGKYSVTVEASGFATETQSGITVDVSQNISIDLQLKIGNATEKVEVKAQGVELATEDAVTGQVVNRRFMNDLPLVSRNATDLIFLAPGVVPTNIPSALPGNINFNSNGSRNMTADVLVDGATATNFEQNSGIQNLIYQPSIDAVEEFKVQQSNFSAEFGFAGATVVNLITRSGTNQFHGSLYEFWRNQILDANDWFANQTGTPINSLRRNNFGGTIGGPIKKDKTFFFFDYEGLREHAGASTSGFFGVPTLCERGDPSANCPVGQSTLGNFGELCTLQGGSFNPGGQCSNPAGQLWDPFTGKFNPHTPNGNGPGAVRSAFIPFDNLATYVSPGAPAKGAVLPATPGNLIDPFASKLLLLFPKPNQAFSDLTGAQNSDLFVSGINVSTNNQFDIKIDHRFSERNLISAKYSQRWGPNHNLNCFKNIADPCTSGADDTSAHLLAINLAHTFSPTLLLNLTYGYTRAFEFTHGVGGDFKNFTSLLAQSGVPQELEQSGFPAVPAIHLTNYATTTGNNIGTGTFSILREGQDVHHLGGALNWIRGKHDLKFGGEWRVHRINFTNPGWPAGEFDFDFTASSQFSNATDTSSGGDSLASFVMGVGQSSQNSGGGCPPCFRGLTNFVSTQSFQVAEFVQDNYRVTPKLTLNIGLRYELSLPRTERFNRMNWLDRNIVSPIQFAQQPQLVQPLPGATVSSTIHGGEVFASLSDRSNYYTDYKDIQPRFGFAYQLPYTFVVRGGYGIYFSTPRNGAAGTGPYGFEGFDTQPPWITVINDGSGDATPCCRLSNPAPNGVPQPPGSKFGALNDVGFAAIGPIPGISENTPYEQAWSFGLQKELPGKILVDTSYIGKKGTHLYLGDFRDQNHLGPQVEKLTPAEIGQLNTQDQPNPFFCAAAPCDPHHFITNPNSGLSAQFINRYQLQLPFPQFINFQGDSPPIANSIYHALQVRVEKEFSSGLQFLVTYTVSKSIDTASATDGTVSWLGGGDIFNNTLAVQDPNNLRPERAVSVFDIPQLLQFNYVYELPVGRGKRFGSHLNPVLNAIVGGWQTNGIWRIDNGRPILPLLVNPTAASIPTYNQRPDLIAALRRASGSPENHVTNCASCTSYFANPGALVDSSAVAPFTLGNAPRTITSVRQPGTRVASLSLFKEFPLGVVREGMRLEFRAEAFNAFNHPQFAGPDSRVSSSNGNYGLINSTIDSSREMQLGLKLYW
ncbi:MAG: TonB-dependent receptor [Candidatus Acidiferrales bacterium]